MSTDGPNYIPGVGNPDTKILFLGEAGGKQEDIKKLPFVGPSGEFLDKYLLAPNNLTREQIWLTNVVKYRPPDNDLTRLHEIGVDFEDCLESLWDEINEINPNVIIPLGNTALSAVTGINSKGQESLITHYRGSILSSNFNGQSRTYKVVPTFHPANFVRSSNDAGSEEGSKGVFKYSYLPIVVGDIKRAMEESSIQEISIPKRYVNHCKSSLDLYRFLEQNKHRRRVLVDIESHKCIPVLIGLAFDREEAISISILRRVSGIDFAPQINDNDLVSIWQLLDDFFNDPSIEVVGHNLFYDIDKLRMYGFNLLPRVASDTLFKSYFANPEFPSRRLEFLTSIFTRQPYYKFEGKEFNPRFDDPKRWFNYNGTDCCVNFEIDEVLDCEIERISSELNINLGAAYSRAMQLFPIYFNMQNRGYRVDQLEHIQLLKRYEGKIAELENLLSSFIGFDFNTNSVPQKQKVLYDILKCPKRLHYNPKTQKSTLKTDEDTIVGLISNSIKDRNTRNFLSGIIDVGRYNTINSRYLKCKTDLDGRIRSAFNPVGTETERTTTGILKIPVRPYRLGVSKHTIATHGDIGGDVRRQFVADKGYILVKADASQAEARVVAVLSKDWDLLRAFDTIDIHRRTAGLVLSIVDKLYLDQGTYACDTLGKDSGERFLGKKVRHAGNYDMQKKTLMINAATDIRRFNIGIRAPSEWACGKMLDLFHSASPNIRGVFHAELRECLEKDFKDNGKRRIIRPSGSYRQFFDDRNLSSLYREAFADIPQNTVKFTISRALIQTSNRIGKYWQLLSEDHDAILFQCRETELEEFCYIVKEEMERPVDFSTCSLPRDFRLSIPADFEVGFSLGDMSKYKFKKAA